MKSSESGLLAGINPVGAVYDDILAYTSQSLFVEYTLKINALLITWGVSIFVGSLITKFHGEMTVRAKVLLCERASTACNKSRKVKIQNAENPLCFIYVLLLMIWST